MTDTSNGWNEWSRHVLAELTRLNDGYESMRQQLESIRVELTSLQVRAGLWGALAGAVPTAVAVAIWILARHN